MIRRILALLLATLSLFGLTCCKEEERLIPSTDPREGYFEEAIFGFSSDLICASPSRIYYNTDDENVICAGDVTDCALVGNRKCNIFYTFEDGGLTEVSIFVSPNDGEDFLAACQAIDAILSEYYGASQKIGASSSKYFNRYWTTPNSRVTISGSSSEILLRYAPLDEGTDNEVNIS